MKKRTVKGRYEMDEDRKREMERSSVGRPHKVYIKGKEPVWDNVRMLKEEWDLVPGIAAKDKSEAIRFAVRLVYGNGEQRVKWINDQIGELKLEQEIADRRFQWKIEVLSSERADIQWRAGIFDGVRRDYPMVAFTMMMEDYFRTRNFPDRKRYTLTWGITCDIEKVYQEREDMMYQHRDKQTQGWESRYNVKKGTHGYKEDEIIIDMINRRMGDKPTDAK